MPPTLEGRKRGSDASLQKVEDLTLALQNGLSNASEALEILVNAAAKGHQPVETWRQLHDIAVREDKVADLAFAYEHVTADKRIKLLPAEQRAFVYLQAVAFFSEVFGDPDGATVYAERALSAVPGHPQAFAALEGLLSATEAHGRLAKLYLDASASEKDRDQQLFFLSRAAELVEVAPTIENDLALDVYQRILRVDAGAEAARASLVRRLLSAGKHRDAAKVLEQSLQREPPPSQEYAKLAREQLIDLYVSVIKEPARALPYVEALLALEPTNPQGLQVAEALLENRAVAQRAAAALSDAYVKSGNVNGAVSTLTLELKSVRGPRRIEVQRRLAILRQDVLGDPAGALELMAPVVAGDPGDDDLRRRFVELSLKLDQPQEAARLLSRALQTSRDPAVRARVGVDVGIVYLKTGDVKRAETAFQQVIETAEDEKALLAAARELGELHAKAGETAGLVNALELVVKHEPDREARQAAARRLTRLYETEATEPARAVVAWKALVGSPWTDEALRKLEELYTALGSHEGLGEVLAHRAERTRDPEEARVLAFKAAELRSTRTRDPGAALRAWRDLIKKYGASREIHQRMMGLLEQEQQWGELADVLKQEIELSPPEERPPLLSRLAQIYLSHLEDAGAALQCFSQALSADPYDRANRAAVEKLLATGEVRLQAADILESIYRRDGVSAGLIRTLEVRGELAAEASERLTALAEAAERAETEVRNPERALELAGKGLAEAVRSAPEQLANWLERVNRFGAAASDPTKQAQLLLNAMGDHPVETPETLALARACGDALVAADDIERAVQVYRRALAFDPSSIELLSRIDELLAQQGSPADRLSLYQAALEQEPSSKRRKELFHASARLLRKDLGNTEAAIGMWRRAVEEDPRDLTAHQALVDAFTELGDLEAVYSELARLLPNVERERRSLAVLRMAEVAGELGDSARALGHYQELMASEELADDVLESVEQLARERDDAETVRAVLERRLAGITDPADQASLLERLGNVQAWQLANSAAAADAWMRGARLSEGLAADTARAQRLYERVLEVTPDNREAAERLLELYARQGDWDSIAEAFGVLLRVGSERDLVATLLALEDQAVRAGGLNAFVALVDATLRGEVDSQRARELKLSKARVLSNEDDRQDEVAAIYRSLLESARADHQSELDAFERFLATRETTPERQQDRRWLFKWKAEHAAEPIPALLAWARAEEQTFGDVAQATQLYQRVFELDPERTDALAELARLRAVQGDADGALSSLKALRERSEGETRTSVELSMASLMIDSLARPEEALSVVAPLLDTNPTDPELLRIVNRALGFPESRAQAAELLERAVETNEDPAQRASVLNALLAVSADAPDLADARRRWLKRLLEVKSDDPAGSYEIALRAAEEARSDEELWDAAERFARELNHPAPLAEAYARAIEQDLAPDLAESLGRRMVEFQEEWFEDPERVIYMLERVLSLCPAATWAFDRLKLAFNSAGRWAELFRLYDRALERIPEPAAKVELLREAAMAAKDFAADAERAIGYLEQLNNLAPQDARVESSLERLYERHGRTEPLISLLQTQLARAEGERRQELRARIASLWLDLSEPLRAFQLAEDMLEQDSAAADAYALLERLVTRPETSESLLPATEGKGGKRKKKASVRERSAAMLKAHYQSLGSTQDVVRMLQVEVETAHDDKERSKRLREITRVRLEELHDEAGAFDSVALLVGLEPEAVEHRELLAKLAHTIARQPRRAEILVEVAERQEQAGLRAELLSEAAGVHRELEEPDRAIELFLRVTALADQRRDTALGAARELDHMLATAGRIAERCTVLEQLAGLERDRDARRAALGEAARLAFVELRDPGRAIRSWRARLADDAEDRTALDGLCEALETAQLWVELIEALESRARIATDPEAARRDGVRIAGIHAEQRRDRASAIEAWRKVRAQHGRDLENYQALVALLTGEQRWQELAELMVEEAQDEQDLARKASLQCGLGELRRDRTGDPLGALAAFVSAGEWQEAIGVTTLAHADKELVRNLFSTLLDLAVQAWEKEGSGTEGGPARAADFAVTELSQRLLEEGSHAGVVELLLRGSNLPFPLRRRRDLKREAACLSSDRLGDSDRAIALFREIFAENPADEVASTSVTRLALLLEERGLTAEIVALWEQQAGCRSESGDFAGAAVLWTRAGELAEQQLNDVERAIADYRQGAGLGGDAALDALARVYTSRGEHKQASEVLEWLCAQTSRELLAERALRLADAYVAAGEPRRARARLEQVANIAIDAGAVRARLAELYREAREWGPLAAVLTEEATRAPDHKTRLELLREAAGLHVKQREDPNSAVPLLQQAVELDPDNSEIRLSLSDALRQAERFDEAIQILRDQVGRYGSRRPKQRAIVHYQLARVCMANGRRAEALAELDVATKIDPAHPGILQALARLALEEGQLERAERMYRGLLLVVGRDDDPDAPSRAESLLDLSEIAERQQDATRATEFVESAFEAAIDNSREARALERALKSRGNFSLLARALRARLEQALPAAEAVRVLADLGQIHQEHLGGIDSVRKKLEGATALHRQLEQQSPNDAEAWSALGRVYDWIGNSEAEAQVLERRVAALREGGETAAEADPFYRLAKLRLANPATHAQGVELLERALEINADMERAAQLLKSDEHFDPKDARAVRLKERIARGTGDTLALLLALELVVGQPGAQQSAAREGVRLARQLGDLDRAESILRSALSKDRSEMPSDHAAWVRIELANLCAERSRIEEALDLREQAIEFVAPEDRRALLLQLAQDAGGISDWKRAAQVYEGLLEREPADRELWQPLLEAYRKLGNTERLVSLIEQTIPLVESAKARARLRLEQAQVLLQQPGTESVAADLLKEILQDDPTHLEAAVMFSGVLEKLGRQHELTDLLAMQLDSAKDRQDIPSIVSITMRLGSLLEQQQRAGEALDLYRGALEWDRSCREMLSAVLRLAMNTGDRDLVADSMESLLKSETGAEASALAARLVALREELFDPPGAERALELGFDKNPADEPTREALLERYRTRSDHQAIARVLQRAIQARPGDHGLLERLVEAQRNAGEPEGALAIINDLIDKEPQNATLLRKRAVLHSELGRDRDALADLERIQLSKGERAEELVLALERAAKSSDSEVSRRATLRLADILESTGQVDSARERLSALIKQAPKDRDSLRKLADLETRAENWSAASTAFRKLLALVEGAALVDTALELAAVCRRADRPEDARAALERAVWVEPNRPGLREQLRELYELTGANRELAQLVLQDAAAEKEVSGRLQGLLRAGELLIGPDGDVNEAVKVLEEARGLSPESMDGIVLLARAYSAAGRSEEGLTLLNQTIEAHRGRRSKALLDVYQEVSRIQLAEGFLSDALSALSKAFDLDMKNFNLAMQVGRLAMEMREEEAATRAFRAVTMLRTDESGAPVPHTLRAEAHYQLALLAQNKGDSKRAKVLAVKALSEDPELEPAKVLLSQIEGT